MSDEELKDLSELLQTFLIEYPRKTHEYRATIRGVRLLVDTQRKLNTLVTTAGAK